MEPPVAVDRTAVVLRTEHHPLPLFTVVLRIDDPFPAVEAGQFVMVLAPTNLEPYLRRAFSVLVIRAGAGSATELEIFGKVIGVGTRALSELRPGDETRVLGPLGRGFDLDAVSPAQRAVLVAGGVGSAALMMLAQELAERGCPFDFLYGGRTHLDLAHGARFADLASASGGEYLAVTEDGSEGERGRVTEPLARRLQQGRGDIVFTCGPDPMMAAVADVAREAEVPLQAALETPMGCGYGACLGCVVPMVDGRLALCCRSGPVFDGLQVQW